MGAAEGEWVFDKFDDDSIKIVKEVQLRKFARFLDDHSKQLLDIQEALGDVSGDSWDANLDPIELQYLPCEQVAVFELICTDNKLLNKVMIVLSSLCAEMNQLVYEAETKIFNALLCYGEGDIEGEMEDGHTQIQIGRIVPLLQEMSFFVTRSYEVVGHVIRQLSSLHSANRSQRKVINVTDLHFQTVYEHMGKLLTALITLDCIVEHHASLTEHWTLYKRMLKSVRHNPQKFGVAENRVRPFEKLLMTLEGQLLDGCIFQNCIQQTFDQIDKNIHVRKNSALLEDFLLVIRAMLQPIEARLGEAGETTERKTLVDVIALFILHNQIFQTVDKKLFKQLWDTHKKVPCVILLGSLVFYPTDYLRTKISQASSVIDKKAVASVQQSRAAWLQLQVQSLLTKEQTYRTEVSAWMVKMESRCGYSGKLMQELNLRIQILTQGLLYAWSLSNFITTFLILHVSLNRPMTKTSVLLICRLVELLKSIQHSTTRRSVMSAETFNHAVQFLSLQALNIVVGVKKQFSADRKKESERDRERNCDIQAALALAENCLNGPGTKERRLVARLALTVVASAKAFKDDDLNGLNQTLHRLDVMCDFQVRLREACDCSFLYWHRVMLPTYLADVYESPSEAARLQYMLSALRDCIPMLRSTRHASHSSLVVNGFKNEILKQLKENLVDVICKQIETDLRLHIHTHLQLDSRNPFKVAGLRQLAAFIRMKPLRFVECDISIKACVEQYLNKTFYNLTTVALHDWRTYSEMRTLAQQKYGLTMMEAHLPSQTLEQGLDVLEIMRNIHVFVSRYLYNLNNQIFVERSSNNKHLNTINIRHIANSIRTHGTGMMNTTVNFTYQFLTKKFFVFSQFLYDDHIKSRLIKDGRYFRESHLQTDQKYPFERAEKFNRGIRKLGLTPDGLSYLDQFRLLVSQIGNAMGYIRMIRSGGLHCCSNAIRFIPDLEDIVSFEELCREESLSAECQRSARQLDEVITNLTKNFAEGTEYFKMLVDVFAAEFRNPKNMHLRNFYLILPPLTLNFIEHMISSKEKLNKKNKVGAAFTDDGFAMGIAYILKLLDQYQEFDSLHWFQSVRDKYTSNKKQVQAQTLSGKIDEKLQQTMTLTVKRLDVNQQEFDLLYYSLSSARIFFRADKTAAEEREENKTKEGEVSVEVGAETSVSTNDSTATQIVPPL